MAKDPLACFGAVYGVTFRSWLERFGDLPAAAATLGGHSNTFRYRLSRATEQVRADLQDPVARIDTHLHLLRLAHA